MGKGGREAVAVEVLPPVSVCAAPAEQPGWQKQQGAEKSEEGVHNYGQESERQRQQPNDREQKQNDDSQRPAERQKNAETGQQQQRLHFAHFTTNRFAVNRYASRG